MICDFSEDYARVKLINKWNFINKNGEFLSDKWFDWVEYFREGYAKVELNNKYNFINKNCEIMSDKWFDSHKDANEYLDNLLKKNNIN